GRGRTATPLLPHHRAGRGRARAGRGTDRVARGDRYATAARARSATSRQARPSGRSGMNASGGSGMDEGDYGADGGAGILEARYRRIMALLPSAYRERRGEEMISTLLDGATEGRRWPRVGEAASLVALAMRLLVGAPGGTRRAVAAGQVLQRTALAGLLALGLWNATAGVANTVAVFSKVGHYYYRDLISSTWTWPFTMNLVQPLAYFGAFAALVRGRRRLGRILGVAQVGMVAAEVLQD